ncbi:MAG: DUF177 domain-containing protein, partial [Clostridia bacterium]|nr:DUF177 domain-containing protein [Clostridia bacterium]
RGRNIRQSTFGMKIQVQKQIALKQYTGSFEFQFEPPEGTCLVPLCHIDGAVAVSGSFEIYDDDSVGVNFTVDYVICGQCSYCLNDARQTVKQDFEVLFVTEEDEDNYTYDGRVIDLTTAVTDAILFSQPNLILCKEDCSGIDVNNN